MQEKKTNIDKPNVGKRVNMTKRIFSAFIALYPILCLYKAFYKITIGDFFLIAFFLIALLKKHSLNKRISYVLIPFIAYVAFNFLINLILPNNSYMFSQFGPAFFRIIKLIFYVFSIILVSDGLFDSRTFEKWMVRLSLVSCIFITIQQLFYIASGLVLKGRIPFLDLYLTEYEETTYISAGYFRPASFFLEPSHLCQYAVVGLVIVLFSRQAWSKSFRYISASIIIIGMLLSTSAQGVLYIAIIIIAYSILEYKNRMKTISILLIGALVALWSYFIFEFVQNSVNRLLFNEAAAYARLGSFEATKELSGMVAFFCYGYGIVPEGQYMTGAAYVWYGCGAIGLIFAIVMFIKAFFAAKEYTGKITCIIFAAMFVGTSLFYNYMLFWYLTLILCLEYKRRGIHENFIHSGCL